MKFNKKAFTLIELLVVVLIIGILTAIALPQYSLAVEKTRAAEAMTNIANIKKQAELYILENGLPASTLYYKDFMTIDLPHESDTSNSFSTRNFYYLPTIGRNGAEIEVSRDTFYTLYATSYPTSHGNNDSPIGGWYHACVTQLTDMGRKICKQYENLGWKYVDREL